MKKVILDTNLLIVHWRKRYRHPRKKQTRKDARNWAKELIKLHNTDAIVTPVYIEMLGGAQDQQELWLTLEFLSQFRRVDEGNIPPQDWEDAIRLAKHLSRHPQARHLGDCLIRAIANRLGYEVRTADLGFPE